MKPELILPAGSLDKLKIAYQYGGDTCYLGLPPFSLRARENQFTFEDLKEARGIATKLRKKLYITCNIYPHNSKIEAFEEHIKQLSQIGPDALICADPGVVKIIKQNYPDAKIHLSVQANTMNYRSAEFWKEQGITRVILPRELTLSEIKEIHEKVPDIELECFVHGAICVAYSGRCLLSQYMNTRDSNQGICSHSCRWKYHVLEEDQRRGEYMPIDEDDEGTYIMNSKDLCALPYLKELKDAGVCGFKVEGRSKTIHYLSTIAKVYRKAIDDVEDGKEFDLGLMNEVNKTANRGFIPGYLMKPFDESSIYYSDSAPPSNYVFIGVVRAHQDLGCEVELKNRIFACDEVEIMTPTDGFVQKIDEIYSLEGERVEVAHGGCKNMLIKIDRKIPVGSILRQKQN